METQMTSALKEAKQSKKPKDIKKAQRTTLQDRISGCVTHGTKPGPQPYLTADTISQESISRYFDLLESTLKEHQLEDLPGQIYHMDETGMLLDPRPPNIIAKSGRKKVNYRQSGKKKQITVIGCGNAIGRSIPPMVIFEGKYLNYE